jgi:hypothetical protein
MLPLSKQRMVVNSDALLASEVFMTASRKNGAMNDLIHLKVAIRINLVMAGRLWLNAI